MKKILSVIVFVGLTIIAKSQPVLMDTEVLWNLSLKYTQISNPVTDGENGFNKAISRLVYEKRDSFVLKSVNTDNGDMFLGNLDWNISDTVIYSDKSFISVLCSGGYMYSNVRMLGQDVFSINYDLENNKALLLNDIYSEGYLKVLSEYCIKHLVKQKSQFDSTITENNQMLIDCAGPDEKNYRAFNLTKNGLLISFITYSVRNVLGTPVESLVLVPYSVLGGFLKPGLRLPFTMK